MGKFSGVTTPKELSLFPQFSLAFLSRSANGCGLLKGAVEGSAWIFYPDKVQDSRVALNHAVCPVWIKHTHIYTQTRACPFTSASPPHHGHMMCLISVLMHGTNCFMTVWKRFVSWFELWCLIIIFTQLPRLCFVFLHLYTSVALALGPDGHVPSLAPTCTVNEDTEKEPKQQISSPKVNLKRDRRRQFFQRVIHLCFMNSLRYWSTSLPSGY